MKRRNAFLKTTNYLRTLILIDMTFKIKIHIALIGSPALSFPDPQPHRTRHVNENPQKMKLLSSIHLLSNRLFIYVDQG